MPLKDSYKKVLADILNKSKAFDNNALYIRVLENDLNGVLAEQVFDKMSTPDGRKDKKAMSVPINYLQKIVNKLSQLYTVKVQRDFTGSTDSDIKLSQYYAKTMHLDKKLQKGNMFYNASKSVLIEVYPNRKWELQINLWSNDRYYVYSSDEFDTSDPEVIVKFIGDYSFIDQNGNTKTEPALQMYSEDTILRCTIHGQLIDSTVNVYGFLPFVQVTMEDDKLFPKSDYDTLPSLLQASSVITDAVVSNFYQAFPMIIITDGDLPNSKIQRNANSVMIVNSKANAKSAPTVQVIQTTLQTPTSMAMAKQIVEMVMDSRGLKITAGQASAQSSGIQTLIDSADVTEVRKLAANDWAYGEENLWEVIARLHNWLIINKTKTIGENKKFVKGTELSSFSEDFTVSVDFPLVDSTAAVVALSNGNDLESNVVDETQSSDTKKANVSPVEGEDNGTNN